MSIAKQFARHDRATTHTNSQGLGQHAYELRKKKPEKSQHAVSPLAEGLLKTDACRWSGGGSILFRDAAASKRLPDIV